MKKVFLTGLIVILAALGTSVYYLGADRVKTELSKLAGHQPEATPQPAATPVSAATPLVKLKELPITLPMLDALFFVDRQFATALKSQLQLTDEQITQLRQTARQGTAGLSENATASTTTAAGERAAERISVILGNDKASQFASFALLRWQQLGASENEIALAEEPLPLASITPLPGASVTPLPVASATETPLPSPTASASPSASPSPAVRANNATAPPLLTAPLDTRIVVNAPAYRMDIFQDGQLVKSYKTTIGYPEFPLPTGMRKANSIIFNPTWTPPDEPWVEASKSVKVGQTVAAGDRLNPLGPIKIPIGSPSLIHGGKTLAKIGAFGSHGCVGLTDKQVQDFAKRLGQIGGIEITDEQIAERAQKRTETKVVKLKQPIPVELRYDTLTVEDGKLHIYRDVYDRDTNISENLEAVLGAYGVALADLSEAEHQKVDEALAALSRAPGQMTDAALTAAEKAEQRKEQLKRQQLTRQFKGKKEVVIEIAALAGKGYPAPVELDTGSAAKPPAKAKKAETRKRK
ncbi:MAG: L,D-transpeptidase [Acidobacteria bacterium]|nr:L,D-transpeptidase [Acidobacteriota bacterium]MBI3428426.1 L,D-transpeptidase [Acidobacteriota bacterium]